MSDAPTDLSRGRVDAHHHVWDPARRRHRWLDPPGMAPIRREFDLKELAAAAAPCGVDRTILVQVLADLDETREFLDLAAGWSGEPVVAGVVGWVDLTAADVADRIAELRDGPGGDRLVGIRHLVQDEPDRDWLTRPDVLRGLRAVAEARLAVDLLVRPPQLASAVRAVRTVPTGRYVLDHLGKPDLAGAGFDGWAGDIRRLADAGETAVKLSGMVTEVPPGQPVTRRLTRYAATVLDGFGPNRVMMGSDWPVCLLAASYAEVVAVADTLTAGLTDTELAAVRAGTAAAWYRLAPAGPQPSPANRTVWSASAAPVHRRSPAASSLSTPASAPSPTTASVTVVRAPTRAPAPTVERRTTAPSPTTAPSSRTEASTVAPGPTTAPAATTEPPCTIADCATRAPDSTSATPTGPGSAALGSRPRTRSAEPST